MGCLPRLIGSYTVPGAVMMSSVVDKSFNKLWLGDGIGRPMKRGTRPTSPPSHHLPGRASPVEVRGPSLCTLDPAGQPPWPAQAFFFCWIPNGLQSCRADVQTRWNCFHSTLPRPLHPHHDRTYNRQTWLPSPRPHVAPPSGWQGISQQSVVCCNCFLNNTYWATKKGSGR